MKKYAELLRNKKLIVSFLIIFATLFFCVFTNIEKTEVMQLSLEFGPNNAVTPVLQSGDVIEQELELKETEDKVGIGVLFATYETVVENGTVEAQLLDSNDNVIETETISADNIEDNQYLEIWFDEIDIASSKQSCTLRLSFEGIEEEMISIWLSVSDYTEYDCLLNGNAQSSDAVLRVMQKETSFSYRDIRLYYALGFILVGVYLIGYKIKWQSANCKIKEWRNSVNSEMMKKIAGFVIVILINILVAGVIEYFVARGSYLNPYRYWLFFVALFLMSMVLVYRNYIWKQAHIYFFIVSMLLGSVNVFAISPMLYLSWDDQIHYESTAFLASGEKGEILEADRAAINIGWQLFSEHGTNILNKDIRESYTDTINSLDSEAVVVSDKIVNWQSVAYVPAAIAICIGRILGFSFTTNFTLGKLANLFCYSLFLALAIKNLKGRGKMLVASLGLIPTMLYMATAYAYDWWVHALVILGYSIAIGEIQKEGKISTGKFIQAVVIMAIGCLPKAVYFPLIFPLMLMRKEKYSESKKCRWIAVIAMVALLASFILPILLNGAGSGDYRGGEGVNSSEQIVFILTNVWTYAQILLRFLWDYLSPDRAAEYMTYMAYVGTTQYYTVCMLVVCVATFLDNDGKETFGGRENVMKIGSYLGAFGSLVLAATALYVSFTAVASNTIAGCQRRYILPVLFAVLFFAGESKIQVPEKTREKLFVGIINVMAFVLLWGYYEACVCLY